MVVMKRQHCKLCTFDYTHNLIIMLSSGGHVLLQNEPAEKLKTDHSFQTTEVKNIPARCVICKKKVNCCHGYSK